MCRGKEKKATIDKLHEVLGNPSSTSTCMIAYVVKNGCSGRLAKVHPGISPHSGVAKRLHIPLIAVALDCIDVRYETQGFKAGMHSRRHTGNEEDTTASILDRT